MVVKFRTPGGSEPDTDGLLKWMRRYNIPITRENYLRLAYMGPYRVKPPVGLTLGRRRGAAAAGTAVVSEPRRRHLADASGKY